MIIGKKQIEREVDKIRHFTPPTTIAIDGPAGTGKSSIARQLAQHYDYLYFSAGEVYRAVTYAGLEKSINLGHKNSEDLMHIMLNYFDLKYQVIDTPQGKKMAIYFEGEMISDRLHTDTLSTLTPTVAQYPFVREYVRNIQRTLANKYDIVMEGRDIGTVVLPHATHKFFLTASPEVRAERRLHQYQTDGKNPPEYEVILSHIIERDRLDSDRAFSPLRPAIDAVIIDNSCLSIEQNLDILIDNIDAKTKTNEMTK